MKKTQSYICDFFQKWINEFAAMFAKIRKQENFRFNTFVSNINKVVWRFWRYASPQCFRVLSMIGWIPISWHDWLHDGMTKRGAIHSTGPRSRGARPIEQYNRKGIYTYVMKTTKTARNKEIVFLNPLVPGNFLCEFFDESSYRGGLWK